MKQKNTVHRKLHIMTVLFLIMIYIHGNLFPHGKRRSLRWHSEKATAPHSSTLAWNIPWTEESGRLQSMRSLRVGHDWATSLSLFTLTHWRRKWQPTPVFLPGESHGGGSLVGCRLWGRTKLDTTSDLAVSAAAGEINQEKRGYATNFPPKQTHEICHNNVGRFHLTTWCCQQLVPPLQALASTF